MAGLAEVSHVVVLMLENRSFDHLLGFLKRRRPGIDGLTGSEAIPRDPAVGAGDLVQVTDTAPEVTDVDPGHAIGDVNQQMYGRVEPDFPPTGRNDGFVANYRRHATSDTAAEEIMHGFPPERVPALATLAEEFAVCDRWFASMPGPTWPNRVFAHAGTSAGRTDNGFRLYDIPTIFERLEAVGRRWCIYYHDIPQALVFPHVAPHFLNPISRKVRPFEQRFADDVRRGRLADYVFIEPRYLDTPDRDADGEPTGRWIWANDQHPPHDIRHGEALIADVYETLRRSTLWSRVLLVIVYDEHGGFYDHVFPEAAIPPDIAPSGSTLFRFDRFGPRVPAVVVSPWIPRGTLDRDSTGRPITRDHTTILATIERRFGAAPLGNRDAAAPTLENLLTLTAPRVGSTEAPLQLPRPAVPPPTPAMAGPVAPQARATARARRGAPRQDRRLNDMQQNMLQLLAHAAALEASRRGGKRVAGTRTVGESVGYMRGATAMPAAARVAASRARGAPGTIRKTVAATRPPAAGRSTGRRARGGTRRRRKPR
jgi:phospholipase C